MSIKHVAGALLLSVFFGCVQAPQEGSAVDVDLNAAESDSIPYSMFVDSITYLDLDPERKCLIGDVGNVAFLDTCIVLFEPKSHKVRLMGRDGRFLRDIGARGAGPGEYVYPTQIDVDAARGLILVYDAAKSVALKYTADNAFVGIDSIGHASDMAYLGGGRYLTTNYNDTPENSGVFLVDARSGKTDRLYNCRDNVPMKKPWEIFRNGGRPAVMSRQYEDKVMEWDGSELMTVCDFSMEPSPDSRAMSEMEDSPRERMKYPDRMLFLKSDRWYYSYYWLEDKVRYIFWDGDTNKTSVTTSLYNDIDGVYGSELPLCISGSFVRIVGGENEDDNPRLQFLHLKR